MHNQLENNEIINEEEKKERDIMIKKETYIIRECVV